MSVKNVGNEDFLSENNFMWKCNNGHKIFEFMAQIQKSRFEQPSLWIIVKSRVTSNK